MDTQLLYVPAAKNNRIYIATAGIAMDPLLFPRERITVEARLNDLGGGRRRVDYLMIPTIIIIIIIR